MKTLFLISMLTLYTGIVSSQNYIWTKTMGSTKLVNDVGYGIVLDDSANVYITGYFSDTTDFDPGPGVANLTSQGGSDIFFAKYDTDGNYLWAKSVGSTQDDVGYSIALDGSANVYITGYFSDITDFDPGPGVANLTSQGDIDIFFAKYDTGGNYLWAKSVGGSWLDYALSITLDSSANVYITGHFQLDEVDFDPDTGVAILYPEFLDLFFAKYDSSGNYLWARNVGGSGKAVGCDIALDPSNNIYLTGYFDGNFIDFDIPNCKCFDSYREDIFFSKYGNETVSVYEFFVEHENWLVFPNPFNEKTTFTYNIDEPGYIELVIHSYDGKHIATLLSGQKDEGSYSVNWNTTDIAPGVYFYSLKVDGVEWVKKAIKIK